MKNQVLAFIHSNWASCIKENTADEGTLIGLPYPYTVPAVGYFDEMFYWDTYFTNKGLLLEGLTQQAKYNVDNMLCLVERFGFMPNGNRTYFLTRSQPPFLSQMVRDIYDGEKELPWLSNAYRILKIEYQFWMTRRCSPLGLNHYDDDTPAEQAEELAAEFVRRIGMRPDAPDTQLARHFYAVAESGWDINPRWDLDCYHYASLELNSLLFLFEMNMAYFAEELGDRDAPLWQQRADRRRQKMFTYMEQENGLLTDCHLLTGKHSPILSAAVFYPLFAGLAEPQHAKAVVENLHRLEAAHGILTCEKNDVPGSYQWDYPNGWACLQYIAIIGLDRYGYRKDARRIASKYVQLVESVFRDTGNLWEKYNVVEGNIQVTNEYGLPAMMGWSAGVYLAALDYLA